jgi:APA family basic amino acid/polyamine antiporter
VTVKIDSATSEHTYPNLYNQLLDYVIPVDVAFYTLMVAAVVVFRKKAPHRERPYRTWLYPLPVLIYVSLAVLLVLDFLYLSPGVSGIGVLIVLAGIPVYLVWSRVAASRPLSPSLEDEQGT